MVANDSRREQSLDTLEGILCTALAIGQALLSLGALVLHVWTIVLAFALGGIVAAVLAFIFPVASWIVVVVIVVLKTGSVVNNYCIATIAYFALAAVLYGIWRLLLAVQNAES